MLSSLFGRDFATHGFGFSQQVDLIWIETASDLASGIACVVIPGSLAWLVFKRRGVAFGWLFWLFALFFLAAGVSRFVGAWMLWRPHAGFQSVVDTFAATVAVVTAALFWWWMPRLLTIPTQLRRANDLLDDEAFRHGRTVEQLRRSEDGFRLFIESVRDCAIYMLEASGHVTSWNAGAEHIKQYRAEEIIGRHFSCFYTTEDRAAGRPARALDIAARLGSYQEQGQRVRKDGSLFLADVVINPIRDHGGKLIGFAKITRDITKRKQAEVELEQTRAALAQAQKMEAVGQLTGGIAHDFNNMLTAVLGSLELLNARQEVFSDSANQMLSVIRHASERGAELTGRLLAFSRKQTLVPGVTDINRLVSGMLELLRRTLGEAVVIETALAPDLWPAFVDSNQVESALLNLAVNARDAMQVGGRLTIETGNLTLDGREAWRDDQTLNGQFVFLSVTDTGSGMTEDVLEHAFEPFYTTKDLGRGTGLGLSQVYGFVKQSGGHVELISGIGRGTTVKLLFPRPEADIPMEVKATPPTAQALPQGNETILVVENDEDVRGYSVNAIRYLGYNVLEAAGAPEALKFLNARPEIQVLFTDVDLPGMSGPQLAAAALPGRGHLKVIYTSGHAEPAVTNLDSGARFLAKPFRIQSLSHMLRTTLDAG